MPLSHNIPFISIFLAMVGGVVLPLAGQRPQTARRLTCLILAGETVLSALLLAAVLGEGESFVYQMGHFPAPWGNELRAGALEAALALAFSGVMLLSVLGGWEDCARDIPHQRQRGFDLSLCLLLSSMLALIYTNDIFTAYVFLEIGTITACAAVAAKGTGASITAAIRYLMFSALGSGMFLLGVSILYAVTGHLLFAPLKDAVGALTAAGGAPLPLALAVLLLVLGLAVKSAQFPFQGWLPDAHGNATTSASAILSGLVLKSYLVLLVRLVGLVFGLELMVRLRLTTLMFWLGAAGMLAASWAALRQEDVKRMIAYSSCAQIGYIFLGLGMGTQAGMVAALYQMLAHAVTKPMIFVGAGTMIRASGGAHHWSALRGAARRAPMAGAAYTVGALSLCGVPLLSGFAAKYSLAAAGLEGPAWMAVSVVLVLAGSTVLNALYYIPSILAIWSRPGREQRRRGEWTLRLSAAGFLALNGALGILVGPVTALLEAGLAMLG